MHLFASFILKILFTLLKDFLFVEGVGLRSNIRHKNGESYFFVDKEVKNKYIYWTLNEIVFFSQTTGHVNLLSVYGNSL